MSALPCIPGLISLVNSIWKESKVHFGLLIFILGVVSQRLFGSYDAHLVPKLEFGNEVGVI